jgi:uncharacterized membrane protein
LVISTPGLGSQLLFVQGAGGWLFNATGFLMTIEQGNIKHHGGFTIMGFSNHTIEVNAPLRVVYNQWTQFEEFPHFMEGVEEVRQEGDKRLLWKARIAGKVKEWEAEITDQVPDQKIAWQSIDGSPNAGMITFNALGSDTTQVNAEIEYEPEGLLEKTGDLLGIPSGRIEGDLKRFRDYIEERGRETGGWRGQEGSTPDTGVLPTSGSHISKDETFSATARADQGETSPESTIEVPLSKENVPVPTTTSAGSFRARNEAEIYRQAVSVPEAQAGEHEAGIMARANDTDQELQNRRSMTGEMETPPVKVHPTGSASPPVLQAVPVTDLEAGEHEAGMVARVSDKEEARKVEPMDNALNDLELETANADMAEGLRCNTFFEPDEKEIARRAYHLYLARGQAAGHEMDDWIEAKRQLLEESNSKS